MATVTPIEFIFFTSLALWGTGPYIYKETDWKRTGATFTVLGMVGTVGIAVDIFWPFLPLFVEHIQMPAIIPFVVVSLLLAMGVGILVLQNRHAGFWIAVRNVLLICFGSWVVSQITMALFAPCGPAFERQPLIAFNNFSLWSSHDQTMEHDFDLRLGAVGLYPEFQKITKPCKYKVTAPLNENRMLRNNIVNLMNYGKAQCDLVDDQTDSNPEPYISRNAPPTPTPAPGVTVHMQPNSENGGLIVVILRNCGIDARGNFALTNVPGDVIWIEIGSGSPWQ